MRYLLSQCLCQESRTCTLLDFRTFTLTTKLKPKEPRQCTKTALKLQSQFWLSSGKGNFWPAFRMTREHLIVFHSVYMGHSYYSVPFESHYLILSPRYCHPVTVTPLLSPCYCHPCHYHPHQCHPVTVTPLLSPCYCHPVTVTPSLSPCYCHPRHCHPFSVTLSLSTHCCHSVTVTLSLSPCYCHVIKYLNKEKQKWRKDREEGRKKKSVIGSLNLSVRNNINFFPIHWVSVWIIESFHHSQHSLL